jgi:hypothetical protein
LKDLANKEHVGVDRFSLWFFAYLGLFTTSCSYYRILAGGWLFSIHNFVMN